MIVFRPKKMKDAKTAAPKRRGEKTPGQLTQGLSRPLQVSQGTKVWYILVDVDLKNNRTTIIHPETKAKLGVVKSTDRYQVTRAARMLGTISYRASQLPELFESVDLDKIVDIGGMGGEEMDEDE